MHLSSKYGKTIDLYNKALLPWSPEIGMHPFIRGLSSSAPQIWFARRFAKPRCRYQPSRANWKISYEVGNWHASPPLRRETAAVTNPDWLDYRLQDIHGPFEYWSEPFFLPLARRGLRRHPYIVLQGVSYRQRRGSAFSVRVVKHRKKLPPCVVTTPSVNVFKKRLEEVWTEVFPYLPHWLNTPSTPSLSTCIPPINSYHLYMLPNSLFYICCFFRPVVAYFLPL